MMQKLVDSALGVAKESIRTFSQESFNSFVRVVNGFSALVLAVLPGKTSALEAVTGWEQNPTFRAPRMPKWMKEGVSSFNQYIPDFEFDSSEVDDSSEYATDTEDEDSLPSSPCSQTSRSSSRGSSFSRSGSIWRNTLCRRLLRRLIWPILFVLRVLRISGRPPNGNCTPRGSGSGRGAPGTLRRSSDSTGSFKTMLSVASKHFTDMKGLVVNHRTTDSRRRGVIEDLQLGVELIIEKVFDTVRRWIHYVLSPLETFKVILRQIFVRESLKHEGSHEAVVQTATLGDSESSTKTDRRYAQQPLNTDARTCGDFITAMGYPYESSKVTTSDGYILSLERIPRPESKEVLYLQHGILDSSLGWVSSGVVGSQAFAAYDQGFDVFLGNFRGLASRDHVNKHISSQRYWRYSVNEHGTQDIPAMLNRVHELKMKELGHLNLFDGQSLESSSDTGSTEKLPYSICSVSHSLGGAAMLIYIVTRRLEGRPHYLKRAILLSPAGFHEKAPPACFPMQYLLPILSPVMRPIFPGLYIPTKFFRMLFNKLSRDFQNYPALGGLVQTLISYVVGGDSSNWIGAFGMTHYNMDDMPGIALDVGLHLSQMMRSKRFMMFNFGSTAANMQAYGTPEPLDVGANYGVIDIPIDVVAGKKDKLIPKSMIARHYQVLKEAGVKVSYAEFEYAHLDFTFSNKDEVLEYVMSRLLLVQPLTSMKKKRMYRRSKSAKASEIRGRNEDFEWDEESYSGSSYSHLKSLSLHGSLEDRDHSQDEERSDRGSIKGKSGSGSGSDESISEEAFVAKLPQDSWDGQVDAKSSQRHSREPGQSLQGEKKAQEKTADPKSGFPAKDVKSFFCQKVKSRIPVSCASTSVDGFEISPEQSGYEGEGYESNCNRVSTKPDGKDVAKRPSNLGRLTIPGSDTSSSKRGVRHRNTARVDLTPL